jgi:hypothetical protein
MFEVNRSLTADPPLEEVLQRLRHQPPVKGS